MNQCKDKIVTYFLKIFSVFDEFILINLSLVKLVEEITLIKLTLN